MTEISAKNLNENQAAYQIIDVRTEFEFGGERMADSINVPLDQLTSETIQSLRDDKKLLLLCQSGARSKKAAEKLEGLNEEITCLEGGLNNWKSAGLNLLIVKKVMSLERQVRICAGALILTGIILMKLGFGGAEYLSAFVGAGLIFAGLTDTCGMGILLSKMPWNKSS